MADYMDSEILYSRGFYMSPQGQSSLFDDLPYFQHVDLGSYKLWHDKVSDVQVAQMGDDWVLALGLFLPLPDIADKLEADKIADQLLVRAQQDDTLSSVEDVLYSLAGRYVIVVHLGGETTVYNDAVATRSVFYDTDSGAIASHLDMLVRESGKSWDTAILPEGIKPQLQWHYTGYPNIYALLGNHKVLMNAGQQRRFGLRGPNPALKLTHKQRLDYVDQAWTSQIDQLIASGHPLAMSLSGGFDSRTMLAMLRDKKDAFTSFTYTSTEALAKSKEAPDGRWAEVMKTDHDGVQLLGSLRPHNHHFIPKETHPWTTEHKDALARNSVQIHGRWLLPVYRELFPDRKTIHYRGNLFEIGRMRWHRDESNQIRRSDEVAKMIGRMAKIYPEHKTRLVDLAKKAMKELDFESAHESYDLTDLWHWEVNDARWYAQVLNETDVAFDTMTPINSRSILNAFLAYPIGFRRQGYFQWELMYRGNPLLTFFGLNGEKDLYQRFIEPTLKKS